MKRLLMILAVLLVWAGSGHAADSAVTLPLEEYRAIVEKLDALQKRVEQLEQQDGQAPAAPAPKVARLEKDVANIYDTLDQVETKSLMDRINLGAELRTRVDFYNVDHWQQLDGSVRSDSNDNFWSNRFRLNLDAEVSENMQFHGRLTAYKNWADNERSSVFADPNSAHVPDTSEIKLDRAYIDWVPSGLPVPVAFTFGRQPSSEGPPFELKENRLRQSTYPALIFDGESDGIVATVGMERYLGLKDSGLRFFYAKGFQDNNDSVIFLDSTRNLEDLNVYASFFETEIPGLRNSLLVLSYVRGEDFVGGPVAEAAGLGAQDLNLGDMDLYGVHLQANKLLGSGLDLFLSTGLNKSHPNGRAVAGLGGLLSAAGEDGHSGYALYTGMRYTLPVAVLNNPLIGFEYNYGSKYWFSYTQGSAEVFNKLATRGNGYDFYYIQPFNKYLFLRTGYTLLNFNYTGSGLHIGAPQSSEAELRNVYMLLDARF